MTNFKIVPAEPTEEMLRVACDEEQRPLPMWTRMKAIYTATLDEAPVINIIATKNKQGQIVSVTLQDEDHRILEVIAESDVQGEHEDDSATVRMDKQCREAVADALGFIRGGNYAWSYLLQQIKDIASAAEAPQPAEQQPAPDVERQPADELRFEYRHPKTGEAYTISLSREEVAELMDQELFEKLTACFCECEPIGETNVVDCRCDEYADQFELVTTPQPSEQQRAPDVPGLTEALRQYRHNDGSGLVFGYDKLLVDQYVAGLVGKMEMLIAAGNRLNAEAEECTYAGNMAEVAGSEYWCEFRDALEAATEAIAAHRKGGGV